MDPVELGVGWRSDKTALFPKPAGTGRRRAGAVMQRLSGFSVYTKPDTIALGACSEVHQGPMWTAPVIEARVLMVRAGGLKQVMVSVGLWLRLSHRWRRNKRIFRQRRDSHAR